MYVFFSVKTTIYDYYSNVYNRRIPKIGKASPKNYHANEQPMSIFEGSWIFQCGKKHDSQGNFFLEKCIRNQVLTISDFKTLSKNAQYVNLKTFLVVMFEITNSHSFGNVKHYTYYSQSNLHCKCLHIAMLMQTRCLFIYPNERDF